jgi:hypothetical protein
LSFLVKDEKGRVDKRKTALLKKKLEKACHKINKVVADEVRGFRSTAENMGVDDSFWRSAAHRAMLILHRDNMEVWLSSEVGDLFGYEDLKNPNVLNTWVDVERLDEARNKWVQKEKKKKDKK